MNHRLLFFFVVALVFSSCATIMHGSKQDINISSSPTNANIFINGESYGNTPKVISLKRSEKDYKVRVELEGYHPYEVNLERKIDGWFWGNILFGGLIGIIVDASNGAMYKLTPDQINARLGNEQGAASTKQKRGNLFIAVELQVNEDYEKIGELSLR